MANAGPNTGSCQFFINIVDNPYLDWFSPGQSKHPVFGKVIAGMDIVDAISKTPRGPSDRPKTPIKMNKVTVSEADRPRSMGARSSSAPRTLVIGDVHGCLDELRALVAKAGVTADDDVVFVGDLVAKGPDSVGVVAWARERGAAAVLGNHDEHVLRARAGNAHAKEQP